MKKTFCLLFALIFICIPFLYSCNASCKTCGDTKEIYCTVCGGDGQKPCTLCLGTGSKICTLCGGMGGRHQYNFMTKMYEYRPCGACAGGRTYCVATMPCSCASGRLSCPDCN